jgi:endoglucanase
MNQKPQRPQIQTLDGAVVLEISTDKIESFGVDRASRDAVWWLSFDALTAPGTYRVVDGKTKSDAFSIRSDVYAGALVNALRHFYFQRCRTALVAPHAEYEGELFKREGACHAHGDVGWLLAEYPHKKTRLSVTGGWHDAGNFDMYVPSTAPTAQALLLAFEAQPELFGDGQLPIPERGNGVPDLLDEVRWGLDWVLAMQTTEGGFRNREAVYEWGEPGPADRDLKPRWVSDVGTASTAKAVAALALAGRHFKKHDAPFATRSAAAAKRGFEYLEAHPERRTVNGRGSPQPLWDDGADHASEAGARFTAAVEYWRLSRDPRALAVAERLLADPQTQPIGFLRGSWVNIARYGLAGLALDAETPERLRTVARSRLLEAAERIRELVAGDGYRCASAVHDYYWGHNANLLERTYLLNTAARLDPSLSWAESHARDQWHWLLGRNPNGHSMVTRVGRGPTRIYHLEWGQRRAMPPGYLVGGPNAKDAGFLAPGAPAKALLWDNPEAVGNTPAHALWHNDQHTLWAGGFAAEGSWSVGWWTVTEPDIYYNANLVLVAAAMQGR